MDDTVIYVTEAKRNDLNQDIDQSTVQARLGTKKTSINLRPPRPRPEELPINKKLVNHVDLIEPVKELFGQNQVDFLISRSIHRNE
ncbi:3102_t:CDS:2 [Diversispora eburnea]|uniref:3102_t:CDS:1 n=1 Tax=Diversispora eburnea TaxID=1213867 RepID=A0A9N9FXW5_9GLOM|nr:3102_t:CDS:2 [Diversispora eburnea]